MKTQADRNKKVESMKTVTIKWCSENRSQSDRLRGASHPGCCVQ